MSTTSSAAAAPARAAAQVSAATFQQDRFVARQKIFSFAPKFFLYDDQQRVLAFLRKKVFSWKDDIRVFTDETQSFELLRIRGRKIIDFAASFDVTDSLTGERVGVLRRRGWKSLLRAEWDILDDLEQGIGKLREDSALRAVVRRMFGHILPQGYTFEVGGIVTGTARRTWNLFVPTVNVDFTTDPERKLDRRLVVAAIILMMTVERVEESN